MQIEAPLRADEAPIRAVPATNAQVTAFFDLLRREQNRYLDAVGSARGMLGPEHAHLAHATAIQLRLTRRMFDAERSIVTHRVEIDAELAAIRREVGLPDETMASGLPNGALLEHGFDGLLDEWWRLEQADRRVALDEVGAVEALAWSPPSGPSVAVQSSAAASAPVSLVGSSLAGSSLNVPSLAGSSMAGSSFTDGDLLPGDLLAALDAADPAHLEALFTSLAEALTSPDVPSPAAVPYTFDDLIIRLEPSDEISSLDALLAPPSTWERVAPSVLEQLRWFLTRVFLPISLVTGSLALAMAWVG